LGAVVVNDLMRIEEPAARPSAPQVDLLTSRPPALYFVGHQDGFVKLRLTLRLAKRITSLGRSTQLDVNFYWK